MSKDYQSVWPKEANVTTEDVERPRKCVECAAPYSIANFLSSSRTHFSRPENYASGCLTHCLACWLGCGPEATERSDYEGDILRDCASWLRPGVHLAVMPIARVTLDLPVKFASSTTIFYPAGFADLAKLNVIPNDAHSGKLSERQSALSHVDVQTLDQHALVAFPVTIDWNSLWRTSHRSHLEFIRYLSALVDYNCLDLIRYLQCPIAVADALPGRAGQLDSDHMMSGALIYNAAAMQARIIGGDAFTHIVTRGLGLPIESVEQHNIPQEGEVGHILRQALALYGDMIEVNSVTSKFTLAMSLMEFLAYPLEYRKFQDVKKIVARHCANDASEYQRILDRFEELTHRRDANNEEAGYRTRIVHMGDRLEWLIRDANDQRKLLEELDRYIRPMIDHMIAHSALTIDEYLRVRNQLKPFARGSQ